MSLRDLLMHMNFTDGYPVSFRLENNFLTIRRNGSGKRYMVIEEKKSGMVLDDRVNIKYLKRVGNHMELDGIIYEKLEDSFRSTYGKNERHFSK